jgi:hypothetical protein
VIALVVAAAFGAAASAASAVEVNIVRQGEAPSGKMPSGVHYYKTIQAAVNASKPWADPCEGVPSNPLCP